MAAFQDIREQTEQKLMVHLLSEIESNPSVTQRNLSNQLGIALGLMNQYLKRCITKGWIRVSQISPKRISYFLTPEGFKEKSSMVTAYLARSMVFFRDAKVQCEEIIALCQASNWIKIALIGESDLADIFKLVAKDINLNIKVVNIETDLRQYDAVLITDIINPQSSYDAIKHKVEYQRLLTLKLLHISRN